MSAEENISSQFSSQAIPSVPSTTCDIHGSSVVLYCKDCGVTLCDTCLTDGSHHNHSYSTLKDACQEQIERVLQRVKKMKSSLLKQSDIRAQVDKAKKDIEEMFSQTKETVADLYQELRELMDQNMQQAFLLIQAQKESMMQGMDQLALEGEKCQEKTKHITQAVEKLKRKQDADSGLSLSEIKALDTSIEAVEDFHRNAGKRMRFDNKRLKALENSVSTIVQRNKDMLPRPWEFAENITFDEKTADKNLETSEDKTQLRYVPSRCPPVGKKSKEAETVPNILASQSFSQGSHYWEVEVKGRKNWTVGVVDKGWVKKGMNQALGQDKLSWALQMDAGSLVALHNDDITMVREAEIEVLGVFLDLSKGWLQFYNVHSGSVLHTFVAKFKNSLYPAFSIEAEKGDVHQMRICALMPQNLSRDLGKL
ncbi:hypothetical protein MATL_G00038060 [Megalops atlanticus]|uniref:Uncharacterized protein n=1 Tax=Megalops atlanticus TaxID=7932 RepID=A0A9D3QF51_MEGAT|nr:hypothetical protein MATL_G00038060 [Megalops atlanticus]